MNNSLRVLLAAAFICLFSNCDASYDRSRESVDYFMGQWIDGSLNVASACYAAPSESIRRAKTSALLESIKAIGEPREYQFIEVKTVQADDSKGGHVMDVQIIVVHSRGRSLQTFRVFLPPEGQAADTPCIITDHTVNLEKSQGSAL